MGFFSKKESILPKASKPQYLKASVPDSDAMVMFDINWMDREMGQGRMPGYALDLAIEAMKVESFRDEVISSATNIANQIIDNMDLPKSEELLTSLNSHAVMGSALGHIERVAGVQIPGLVHPSIWNAFYSAKRTELEGVEFQVAAAKAVEVGYYIAAGNFDGAVSACARIKPFRD